MTGREAEHPGVGQRMLSEGGRPLSEREEDALRLILAADDELARDLGALQHLRVATRSTCCPTITFAGGGARRSTPHASFPEQLRGTAVWTGDEAHAVQLYKRGDRLSSLEWAHHGEEVARHTEFPSDTELEPRPL